MLYPNHCHCHLLLHMPSPLLHMPCTHHLHCCMHHPHYYTHCLHCYWVLHTLLLPPLAAACTVTACCAHTVITCYCMHQKLLLLPVTLPLLWLPVAPAAVITVYASSSLAVICIRCSSCCLLHLPLLSIIAGHFMHHHCCCHQPLHTLWLLLPLPTAGCCAYYHWPLHMLLPLLLAPAHAAVAIVTLCTCYHCHPADACTCHPHCICWVSYTVYCRDDTFTHPGPGICSHPSGHLYCKIVSRYTK